MKTVLIILTVWIIKVASKVQSFLVSIIKCFLYNNFHILNKKLSLSVKWAHLS